MASINTNINANIKVVKIILNLVINTKKVNPVSTINIINVTPNQSEASIITNIIASTTASTTVDPIIE